jgi:acyl dehydratase
MVTTTVSYADLPGLVGKSFVSPEWLEVRQEQVNEFARATGDHQWIHVDPVRAASDSPFGGTIAHGYMSLSLVPAMLFATLAVTGARLVVNYGANKVRFPAPLRVGSRVRLGIEVAAVEPMERGFQVTIKAALEVEGGNKPVMAAELLYRYQI